MNALKALDDKLLAKSSLDIALLPETQQDRQMAALMKLQSKSAQEREEEKRIDILLQPALPGSTQTTFGGLKRQKALSTHLDYKQLGIKRKHNDTETTLTKDNEKEDENQQKINEDKSIKNSDVFTTTETQQNTTSNSLNGCLVNLPQSLALVCDYASSNSSPETSSPSDNEES